MWIIINHTVISKALRGKWNCLKIKSISFKKHKPAHFLQNICLCTKIGFLSLMPLIIYHAKNYAIMSLITHTQTVNLYDLHVPDYTYTNSQSIWSTCPWLHIHLQSIYMINMHKFVNWDNSFTHFFKCLLSLKNKIQVNVPMTPCGKMRYRFVVQLLFFFFGEVITLKYQ